MIPFPKIHIAESVLNRIQNTLDDIEPLFPSFNTAPIPPQDPIALGQHIEQQTETPPIAAEIPADPVQAAASEESLLGGSPLDGALVGLFEG